MITPAKFLLPLALLFIVLLLGSAGYSLIEGWSLADSFYMTVITIATVGFTEVHELSPSGRIYTIFVILIGVGVVGFTLSNFTAFLVSGQIRELLRAGKMQKRIAKLKDHYIVCGAGRMGSEAVRELVHERKELVVVDRDLEKIRQFEAEGVPVIHGDATHDDVLIRAGVEQARGLLATLPDDAANVFVTLSARGMNPHLFIIARGADESSQSKLPKAGANRVVLPYHIAGTRMASMLVRPEIVDFFDVVMGKDELSLRMEIIRVRPGSPLAGHSLKDSNIRRESGGALIMGIIRKDGKMIPTPDRETQVLDEDQLLVLGHLDQIARLEQIAR